ELANVRVYDPSGVAFEQVAGLGRESTPDALDRASILAALTGSTVHGDPFESGDAFLMAGYAPVRDRNRATIAAIAVEADARFFGAVRRLRWSMIAAATLSALVLAG